MRERRRERERKREGEGDKDRELLINIHSYIKASTVSRVIQYFTFSVKFNISPK